MKLIITNVTNGQFEGYIRTDGLEVHELATLGYPLGTQPGYVQVDGDYFGTDVENIVGISAFGLTTGKTRPEPRLVPVGLKENGKPK